MEVLCMLVLGLALFDSVADTVACAAPGTACHACSCGPHLVSPPIVEVAKVSPRPVHVSYKPSSYAFLISAAIFHPPCLAA